MSCVFRRLSSTCTWCVQATKNMVGVTLLAEYSQMWKDYATATKVINNIFNYMVAWV